MPEKLTKLNRTIKDHVAVVTGAASGIGRATAHLLADEDARVAILDIDKAALDRVAREIVDIGAQALPIHVDLTKRDSIRIAISEILEHFGRIDILINNAGFAIPCGIENEEFDQVWDRSLTVMAKAQAWMISETIPSLRLSPHARVVNVASTEALGATALSGAYTVAKHACVGLTRAMAVDLGPYGITVNCVCPGPIHTSLTAPIPEENKTTFARRRTALGRYGDPEEVAHAILGLVLPAASYITGAVLTVDGGLTVRNA